jgi:phage terminase Nu1 subunit (DNA packaging protein)
MAKAGTQARLATKLGVSQQRVAALAKRGMPLDLAGARKWRAAHLDASKLPKPDGHVGRLTEARTRLADLQHRKLELEISATEERLVDRATVVAAAQRFVGEIVAQLDAMPSRLAPTLVGLNQIAINRALRAWQRSMRADLSQMWAGRACPHAEGGSAALAAAAPPEDAQP